MRNRLPRILNSRYLARAMEFQALLGVYIQMVVHLHVAIAISFHHLLIRENVTRKLELAELPGRNVLFIEVVELFE